MRRRNEDDLNENIIKTRRLRTSKKTDGARAPVVINEKWGYLVLTRPRRPRELPPQ